MKKYTVSAIAAAIVVAAIIGFFLFRTYGDTVTNAFENLTLGTAPISGVVIDSGPNIPAGFKEYSNTPYQFQLYFPADLDVKEYKENGNGLTVTFHLNDGTNGGFQVFILPYQGSQITSQRFRLDEPSGIRDDQTAIIIDNTPASMFFSTNTLMGDTREVWFLKNGFLYEVTTYKELDADLASVMQTWKFLPHA